MAKLNANEIIALSTTAADALVFLLGAAMEAAGSLRDLNAQTGELNQRWEESGEDATDEEVQAAVDAAKHIARRAEDASSRIAEAMERLHGVAAAAGSESEMPSPPGSDRPPGVG